MNPPALVVGGAGMLGDAVVRRLLDDGFAVRVLVRDPGALVAERAIAVSGDVGQVAAGPNCPPGDWRQGRADRRHHVRNNRQFEGSAWTLSVTSLPKTANCLSVGHTGMGGPLNSAGECSRTSYEMRPAAGSQLSMTQDAYMGRRAVDGLDAVALERHDPDHPTSRRRSDRHRRTGMSATMSATWLVWSTIWARLHVGSVGPVGLEPTTKGLKVLCSAN